MTNIRVERFDSIKELQKIAKELAEQGDCVHSLKVEAVTEFLAASQPGEPQARCPKCESKSLQLGFNAPVTPQDDRDDVGPYVVCGGCGTKTFSESWQFSDFAQFFRPSAPSPQPLPSVEELARRAWEKRQAMFKCYDSWEKVGSADKQVYLEAASRYREVFQEFMGVAPSGSAGPEPEEFDPPCKCDIRKSRLKQGVIGPHHGYSCPQYGGVRPENEPQRMAKRVEPEGRAEPAAERLPTFPAIKEIIDAAFKIQKINLNCYKLFFFGSFLGAHHTEMQAYRRSELLAEHMLKWAKPWMVDAEAANVYCRDLAAAQPVAADQISLGHESSEAGVEAVNLTPAAYLSREVMPTDRETRSGNGLSATSASSKTSGLADQTNEMLDVLKAVAIKFREYEKIHAAKPDKVKAENNAAMALMCERVISKYSTNQDGKLADLPKVEEVTLRIAMEMFGEDWPNAVGKLEEMLRPYFTSQPPAWLPIETAPKDGRHIQAADFSGKGVGFGGNPPQSYQCVVHWWQWCDGTHQEEWGWYPSTGAGDSGPLTNLTHFKPLEELAAPPSEVNVPTEEK